MKRRSLPRDVIDKWPEIFNDIEVRAIPLEYLESITIVFKDGKTWEVSVAEHAETVDTNLLEEHLQELVETYETAIEHIDLRIDVKRVKKDIIKKTKKFLKTS